ncbi:hypothetical protein PVAP13_2KG592700 [Panicum virgatum]|uniref:REF/SRPP-like protein n=1 Tax=Panicum virgatum TaxID=38727 RepID=A0A8T0WWC3_PANVG|nr:hypothetical protein PVAP13_2KG592700 [Panicum virgatum]
MAEQPNPQPQVEEKEVVVEQQQEEPKRAPKLRYLDFVHVAAAQAAVCLAGLYGLAKGHAGPLRPGVDAVESAVKGLVGPVYDRFHSVPLDVLAFVDRKVDDTVHGLDKHLPGALKAASAQAYAVARGIPEVARELAAEAQQSGVKSAARAALAKVEPVAKDVYGRVEPVATDLSRRSSCPPPCTGPRSTTRLSPPRPTRATPEPSTSRPSPPSASPRCSLRRRRSRSRWPRPSSE